jgi:hypothetical protein
MLSFQFIIFHLTFWKSVKATCPNGMQHPGTSLTNSVVLIKEMHKTDVFVYQKKILKQNIDFYVNKLCLYKPWLYWYVYNGTGMRQANKRFHTYLVLRLHRAHIQGDQKVSVHLMITIQKVTSNVQSVPRQSPDIYWHAEQLCSRRPCSV